MGFGKTEPALKDLRLDRGIRNGSLAAFLEERSMTKVKIQPISSKSAFFNSAIPLLPLSMSRIDMVHSGFWCIGMLETNMFVYHFAKLSAWELVVGGLPDSIHPNIRNHY